MYSYLTEMDKYNSDLPTYIDDPLSASDLDLIWSKVNEQIDRFGIKDSSDPEVWKIHFQPRIMKDLSRLVIEFDFPKEVEESIDKIILPMYKEEIRLSHFSYLRYDTSYSDNLVAPALPPHIDAAETLITFNYQLGGNVEWPVVVDEKEYDLKTGDALIFSAVNQIHWRPKRVWHPGEYVEILTVNYSPLSNWRFTGESDPIHPVEHEEQRAKYFEDLNSHPRMHSAWNYYNSAGLAAGIDSSVHGLVVV